MVVPGRLFLRNVIERRSLIAELVRRDFEQRFVGSAAGWLWGLLQPLVMLFCWTFVFQWCLNVPAPKGEVTANYSLWLFCGFLPWMLFQETLSRSVTSLVENSNLITRTIFPSEVVSISIFLSSLLNHLLALSLAVAVTGLWLGHFSFWIFLLPVYMVMIGLFSIGLGWIVSSLQVYLRDTAQLLTVGLTLWFWTTPIMIDESHYPHQLRFLLKLNPFAYLVRGYRDRLLSFRLPDGGELLAAGCYSIAAFVIGGLFFRQMKRGFADVL